MAVSLRLQRGGSNHEPVYRLVAADHRAKRDGRFIEKLGTFTPKARGKTPEIIMNLPRVEYWLGVGAQPSDTVHTLIKRARASAAAAAAAAPVQA